MTSKPIKSPVWRAVKITLGVILVPLGIVGLFLPFLQGGLFLLAAMALLATEVPMVARFRDRIRAKYPGPWREGERLSNWFRSRFGKGARAGDEG
jgi:uncharacterized membrane protein YbaN (DUF454 family)